MTDLPPQARLYTFEEIVQMLDNRGGTWQKDAPQSSEQAILSYIEYMEAEGFAPGMAGAESVEGAQLYALVIKEVEDVHLDQDLVELAVEHEISRQGGSVGFIEARGIRGA